MHTKKTIVCLMGPTASGKTDLAVKLVQHYPFEIISVDSAMVYKGMDIGTAKPEAEVLKIAPHRLIDFRDPNNAYSAAEFCVDAIHEIEDIFERKKIPLLVGGTMLYFRALQNGLSELPSADPVVRSKLLAIAEQKGWPFMHNYLCEVDPTSGKRIHPHDTQRIQRALEVYEITGQSLTEWQQNSIPSSSQYNLINIAITPDNRAMLHERIALRFDKMLAAGFMNEVSELFKRTDLDLETPAIRSVGYRQAWSYLLGNISFEEMREKAITSTRQLAKRQLTWLRHWPQPMHNFKSEAENLFEQVELLLKTYGIK